MLTEKIRILTESAKYDASCSSSASKRKNKKGGLGNAASSGICHSWSEDGRCISLLKILMTNHCVFDCDYCINRRTNDIERALFTPRELADLTINFYKRNYIEGLFLSSGVYRSPDETMFRMIEVCKILRNEYNFNGYIHAKVIPKASQDLTDALATYADRISVNIEMATEEGLKKFAPNKSHQDILVPMMNIKENIIAYKAEKKNIKSTPLYAPAGQSTQMIIGADSMETDRTIIHQAENLYGSAALRRVFYSAFVPVQSAQQITTSKAPLVREHRLYQADWLMRFYHFNAKEILSEEAPNLSLDHDPKVTWALRNRAYFPVEVNRAEYEELLRVPGIGPRSAQRIIQARRLSPVRYDHLQKMGVVLKRAKYFITANGDYHKYNESMDLYSLFSERKAEQLRLF